MAWLYLLSAGFFEICFTTTLKLSGGFSKLIPSLLFVLFAGLSFWLLTKALDTVPLGTAYAVWTGIGAFGTALVGIIAFAEPVTFWRVFFLLLIVAAIAGLKLVSN